MPTADVVIIGAGFAGASTAYHLARRGVGNVVVLEREAVPGVHASGRNAALAFTILSDPAETSLAIEGTAFLSQPPEGFSDDRLLDRIGSLQVAGDAGLPPLQESQRRAAAAGWQCDIIAAAEATRRVPVLANGSFSVAFWNPYDGVVDIHALLQGYLNGARAGGVRIEYRREVRAIRASGGRVVAVETDAGVIDTCCVVNAAGGWAGRVGELAGVGARSLAPRRRHLLQMRVDVPIDRRWPFVWHNDVDLYFRPERDGLLMSPCDATAHPPQEPIADHSAQELLAEKLPKAFPCLATARVASMWACLRTFARDERFVIGRDPQLEGLVWVAALGGHGMTTSAAVGRLGAAAVLAESSDELAYFSPSRLV